MYFLNKTYDITKNQSRNLNSFINKLFSQIGIKFDSFDKNITLIMFFQEFIY